MNDGTDFERRLITALALYAKGAPVEVDPVTLTSVVARRRVHRRWSFLGRAVVLWRPDARVGLLLIVLGLTVALLVGAIATGAFRADPRDQLLDGRTIASAYPSPSRSDAVDVLPGSWVADKPDNLSFETPSGPATMTLDLGSTTSVRVSDLSQPVFGSAMMAVGDHELELVVTSVTPLGGGVSQSGTPVAIDHVALAGCQLGDVGRYVWSTSADGAELTLESAGDACPSREAVLARTWTATPTGRIAFVRDGDIWVMNADGSDPARLTSHPGPDESPVWSPDATRIAFIVGDTAAQVWVMDADGSNQRQVTHSASPAGRPTWSPDGSSLAYAAGDVLYVVGVDGGGLVQITQPVDRGDVDPAWSPQGDRIAFANGDSIYTVRPDGSARALFAQHFEGRPSTNIFRRPAWSPDGTRIAVTLTDPDGNSSIWLEDGHNNEANLTAGTLQDPDSPTWSPSGRWLALTASSPRTPSSYEDVYVINAVGYSLGDIMPGISRDLAPAWSSR